MGFFPQLDININATIDEFLTVLRDINTKLDTLIALQRDAAMPPGCVECDLKGRLHCRLHGPIVVPANTRADAD